jgi:ABC-type lipopolysaccharide export system ATPase subunit
LLWDEFCAFPVYQQYYNKTVDAMSCGEWRQIEMLMILYSRAKFILLDEPFTHISPIQVDEFKRIIRDRAQTRGIIVTDHYYKNVLEVSDRLLLISNGYTEMISDREDLVRYGYLSV